jgi:hypothetical protein
MSIYFSRYIWPKRDEIDDPDDKLDISKPHLAQPGVIEKIKETIFRSPTKPHYSKFVDESQGGSFTENSAVIDNTDKKKRGNNDIVDVREDISEPHHNMCRRITLLPIAATYFATQVALAVTMITYAPFEFLGMTAVKVGACALCCHREGHIIGRNIVCTPCRLARISFLGVGHIGCAQEAWPFMKAQGLD